MKKRIGKVLAVLVILIILVLVAANVFLGRIVKAGVEKAGPQVVGVPMTLDSASISLVKGKVNLSGLIIGNPEGYTSEHAFSLGTFTLAMRPRTVLDDDIVIDEVVIDSPEIVYELSLKGSNLGAIIDGLKKDKEATPEKDEETPPKAEGPKKRVQITDLYVRNATVKVTSKLLKGKGATVALSEIHLKNVGEDTGGISLAGATELLLGTVLKSVVVAIKDSGDLATDLAGAGLNLAGDLAGAGLDVVEGVGAAGLEAGTAVLKGGADATKALVEGGGKAVTALGKGAGEAIGSVGAGAGKAVGAAGEAAGKSVEAVGGGVKAVGTAAKDGAGKLLKGVGGLLGKGKEDEKKAE